MSTVQVKLSKRVVDEALALKPDYDTNAAHLSRLIELGIDAQVTLGARPAGAGSLFLSSKAVNKEEKDVDFSLVAEQASVPVEAIRAAEFAASIKEQGKRYSPGFEAFWKVYQSCPDSLRSRSQTKPKAFQAYKEALKAASAEELQKAVEVAVQGQLDAQQADKWVPSLPDAYRWLRDGRFEVLLEDHQPAQADYNPNRL